MALFFSQIVALTHDQAKQELLDLWDFLGFPATSWEEGEPGLHVLELGAHIYSKLTQFAVFLRGMGLNDESVGEGLTRLARSHYANEREPATNARRLITLACASGEGPHTLNPGDLVVTDGEHTVRLVEGNDVVFPFALSGGSSQAFVFEAEVAGLAPGIPPANSYTTLVTTLAGVTVTQDINSVAGRDEETDERLRLRNVTRWPTLAPIEMIRDAVINCVLGTPGATAITKVEVDDQNPRGEYTFDVYIASDFATAGSEEVAAVQARLAARVFGTDTVRTYAAPPVEMPLVGSVYYAGADGDAVKDAVLAQLREFLKTIPLGGFDYSPGPSHEVPINDIESVIRETTVNGVRVVKTVVLTTPAGNLPVTSFGKVIEPAGGWTLTFRAIGNP